MDTKDYTLPTRWADTTNFIRLFERLNQVHSNLAQSIFPILFWRHFNSLCDNLKSEEKRNIDQSYDWIFTQGVCKYWSIYLFKFDVNIAYTEYTLLLQSSQRCIPDGGTMNTYEVKFYIPHSHNTRCYIQDGSSMNIITLFREFPEIFYRWRSSCVDKEHKCH